MKTLSESMQMSGGIFLWTQLFVILLILVMAARKFPQYFGSSDVSSLPFHRSHHAILFLGIFNLVWGMFSQVLGFVQALNAIIAAADVSPAMINWRQQVDTFAEEYRVVTMDLAGHGKSGTARADYTLQAYRPCGTICPQILRICSKDWIFPFIPSMQPCFP